MIGISKHDDSGRVPRADSCANVLRVENKEADKVGHRWAVCVRHDKVQFNTPSRGGIGRRIAEDMSRGDWNKTGWEICCDLKTAAQRFEKHTLAGELIAEQRPGWHLFKGDQSVADVGRNVKRGLRNDFRRIGEPRYSN